MLSTFWYLWNGFNWHLLFWKCFFVKQKPRIIKYRDYKKFNSITFKMDLLKELSLNELQKGDFNKFMFLVNKLLEFNLTWMKNVGNVCKAIVVRTHLLNRFRKENLFLDEFTIKDNVIFVLNLSRRQKETFIIILTWKKLLIISIFVKP